jgi:hypothetical protein
VHLLTREAFGVYLKHLADGGAIVVHVSNLHLQLRPIVERVAKSLNLQSACIIDDTDRSSLDAYSDHASARRGGDKEAAAEARKRIDDLIGMENSTWIMVTRDAGLLAGREIMEASEKDINLSRTRLWTDDDTNLFEILRK